MLALPPEHCLCCLWGCCATLLRILMWSPMRKRAAHDGFLVVGGLALSFPTILQQRGLVPRRAMSLRKTLLVFHSNECISFFFLPCVFLSRVSADSYFMEKQGGRLQSPKQKCCNFWSMCLSLLASLLFYSWCRAPAVSGCPNQLVIPFVGKSTTLALKMIQRSKAQLRIRSPDFTQTFCCSNLSSLSLLHALLFSCRHVFHFSSDLSPCPTFTI